MRCEEARGLLLEARVPADRAAELEAHLAGCAACRHEDAAERALTEALSRRLPRYKAPAALKQRLEEQLAGASRLVHEGGSAPRPPEGDRTRPPSVGGLAALRDPPGRSRPTWMRPAAALAAGLAVAAGVALYYERDVLPRAQATAQLETEAVNDHLRILYSERPLEVQSGGIHQVKPWFAGRLDFAPAVAFAGDDDFPLQGGAVSWFLDRKAAAFVFKRRLHTISLFVFRADGLDLPGARRPLVPMGHAQARAAKVRGFNVLLWRDAELGYALVSDVDAGELATLGARIAP